MFYSSSENTNLWFRRGLKSIKMVLKSILNVKVKSCNLHYTCRRCMSILSIWKWVLSIECFKTAGLRKYWIVLIVYDNHILLLNIGCKRNYWVSLFCLTIKACKDVMNLKALEWQGRVKSYFSILKVLFAHTCWNIEHQLIA